MAGQLPPSLKLHLNHGFSMKTPSSSSSSSSSSSTSSSSSSSSTSNRKIKTLIHSLLFSYTYRITRFFSKSKSVFFHIITLNKPIKFLSPSRIKTRRNKIFFGSFRLHYNWCSSSHVTLAPAPEGSFYYDSTWDSFISTERKCEDYYQSEVNSKLSGYLQWLEERKFEKETNVNEIDQMAEIFIANCHEKFKLEKQESYRRFQEMLARSM